MIRLPIKNTGDWLITYNPYTDILQLYKKMMLTADKESFKTVRLNSDLIVMSKDKDMAYFVELKRAYSKLGDIDNKPKKNIIREVKEYVLSHG